MIRQIAPEFFTTDIPRTLGFYKDKLGFECQGTWPESGGQDSAGQDRPGTNSPIYAIVARDGHAIHFRCAAPPVANPDKYEDELLDAYFSIEDADALHAEYAARGVEFTRELGDTPWHSREFVVKDCDGRLLAFGSSVEMVGAAKADSAD
jgi:uncharacterized glyoxalase superfamily protein PhnB